MAKHLLYLILFGIFMVHAPSAWACDDEVDNDLFQLEQVQRETNDHLDEIEEQLEELNGD